VCMRRRFFRSPAISVGTRSVATAFLTYESSQFPDAASLFSLFDLPLSSFLDTSAQQRIRLSLEYIMPSKSESSFTVRAFLARFSRSLFSRFCFLSNAFLARSSSLPFFAASFASCFAFFAFALSSGVAPSSSLCECMFGCMG
jgi:hypothetical protein